MCHSCTSVILPCLQATPRLLSRLTFSKNPLAQPVADILTFGRGGRKPHDRQGACRH